MSGRELPAALGERADRVTNAVLAALLAEITTLSKDQAPHTAAAHATPPPAVTAHTGPSQTAAVHAAPPRASHELLAALDERDGSSDDQGVVDVREEVARVEAVGLGHATRNELLLLAKRDGRGPRDTSSEPTATAHGRVHSSPPQAQPPELQHPALPELLADLDECGARVAASTEQCRASTGAMRAEMATFAAAMQITPPRRRPSDSHQGPEPGATLRALETSPPSGSPRSSPSSSGARIVIRARAHGAIGFVRLPLAADATDATSMLAGDWRGRLACHYRRDELAGDCSPDDEPAGATFAAVRVAISAQLAEAVAHVLPAGASCSMVKRPSGCAHWLCLGAAPAFGANALYGATVPVERCRLHRVPLGHPQVLRVPCLCGRIRGGRRACRAHSGELSLRLTLILTLTLTLTLTP